MNTKQMQAAKEAMAEWLAHPQELGHEPAVIECAGTFELHDMLYYLFKYQPEADSVWLLGVCGGYEDEGLEHCGHVFSEMEPYEEATAIEKATAMVEMVRSYWMEQAKQIEERKNRAGSFAGFVLMAEAKWNKEQLINDLKTEWGIEAVEDNDDKREDSLVFDVGNMIAAVSLMPSPIPDGEAEANAANNYMWPEAVDIAKAHKAHIMVAIIGKEENLLERGKLFTKILACCCAQPGALGVYTSGVVFAPWFYAKFANIMKEGELPIYNWIWIGLYRSEKGFSGYTYGMVEFGKDEMEVLDADADPNDLRDFIYSLAGYVLAYDVTLKDGETIGFSAEDKHAITYSEGVSLPGMTLKIEY